MTRTSFSVEGLDALSRKLKGAGDKVRRREVVRVLRAAAKDTIVEARRQAPESKQPHVLKGGKVIQPGNLKKSIKFQTLRRSINPGGIVGPRSLGRNDGFYGRQFVIPGHNIYRSGFRRNRRGNRSFNANGAKARVPANPFMLRAYNATRGRVSDKAKAGMDRVIQRILNKL